MLSLQFREGVAHLLDEGRHELIEEALLLPQERIGIAHGTAQDATDDVTSLGIRGQLSVCDGEGHGAQMVGTNAHGDVDTSLTSLTSNTSYTSLTSLLLKRRIFQSSNLLLGLDDRLEDIGIIVGMLALEHAYEALEAHTGIDDVHRELLERAVGLTVELHEHEVPDLDDLGIVLIHQVTATDAAGGTLLRCTRVDMDLRTGTTGTRIAHLPEVVVLVAVNDMIGRHVLGPVLGSLVVTGDILFGRTLKDGYVEILGIQFQHVDEVLPGHVDGALLEVVAKRPVAQHLEHRVVIGVVAYFLEVVVLSADTETLLGIGTTSRFRVART